MAGKINNRWDKSQMQWALGLEQAKNMTLGLVFKYLILNNGHFNDNSFMVYFVWLAWYGLLDLMQVTLITLNTSYPTLNTFKRD